MAVILSIETSTSVCSTALHQDGVLVEVREIHTPQSAASQLTVLIEEIFTASRIPKTGLAAVAVSIGPGSYTGLRIGLATAKGICYALGLPLICADSLQVMASGITPQPPSLFCPMIDARRMEVYYSLLDPDGNVLEPSQPKVIDGSSFADHLQHHNIVFFGDGATKCRDVIQNPRAIFLERIYPSAAHMGKLAYNAFRHGRFADLATTEPNYLKEFKAKTKMAT